MENERPPAKPDFSKFRGIRPRRVDTQLHELVNQQELQPGESLPLLMQPCVKDVDLIDWVRANRDEVEQALLQHGAILFRGFGQLTVDEFERFAQAATAALISDYGDLPRSEAGERIYGSTVYPEDQAILFHNESSHMSSWPQKIMFFCVQAAQQAGETPLMDCGRLCRLLDPAVRGRFQTKQLMYVRTFTEGLDVPWQQFFGSQDRAAVEAFCRQNGMQSEWSGDDQLRIRKVRPALVAHPKTGELLFFNQLLLHHVSCLPFSLKASLLSVFDRDNLPRNVYYGDGSPIEDEVVAHVGEVCWNNCTMFAWQNGDIALIDNMKVAHARNPYHGPRRILVALGDVLRENEAAGLSTNQAMTTP